PQLLDDAAAQHPLAKALAFFGATIGYRDLKDQVDRFAGALTRLGVRRGDRVALVLPNCPQHVIAFFATLRLGAVVVAHNPLGTEREMTHQLADCGAEVVVTLDRIFPTIDAIRSRTQVREVVVTSISDYLPALKRFAVALPLPWTVKARAQLRAPVPEGARARRFLDLLRAGGAAGTQLPVDPGEVAVLQYTTGTSGPAKGAMLTHANLVANAYQCRWWLGDARVGREVTLAVLPLFHAYGLTLCLTTTVLLSGMLVLLPNFDQDQVLKAIDDHRPTLFPGVPPIYQALLANPKVRDHDLSSIRVCISGAMKLPVQVIEQFERGLSGGRLVEGYGLTETSPVTHANPIVGPRKEGTVGLPLPLTEARVVDPADAGTEVAVGEVGELAVRGPQVFAGYWNHPEESAAAVDLNGWLLTGDLARMDADGFFEIVDRKKDLIIAGGFNVYPTEVEEVLEAVPGVAQAAVIGLPDPYRGETVKAFVVRSLGAELSEEDLLARAAESLSAYKLPKLIEFRDSLPLVGVGKVLRRALREEEAGASGPASSSKRPAKAPAKRPAKEVGAAARSPRPRGS
ncbi:MAG: long-chain-fatty-acid--CoA ligase, partial [Mycobacteriales bacterium]